jgi:hypothetical protein
MPNRHVVLGILIVAAFLFSAIVCHFKGDEWEDDVRVVLYSIKRDTVPSYATDHVDTTGVPFVYYAPQNGISAGTRYNATIVANYAINYYNQFSQTNDSAFLVKFDNCIDWLLKNMTRKEHYALFQFDWQQPWYPSVKAPFTSGMTSGRAIEAFVLAYSLHNDSTYLDKSLQLLRGFYQPIQLGGFTYKEPQGWWYEEVADSNGNTPKIIDGHIYAIQGVQKLWEVTNNDSAKTVITKGLQALKNKLPEYDAGNGVIYYDADKKVADKKYQRILATQMLQLYNSTGDPVFQHYYKKWSAPMERTYIVRIFTEMNRSGIVLFLFLAFAIGIILYIGYKVTGKIW